MQVYLSFAYWFIFLFTSKMVLRTCSSSNSHCHTHYTYFWGLKTAFNMYLWQFFTSTGTSPVKSKVISSSSFAPVSPICYCYAEIYKWWDEKQEWKKACQCETPFFSCPPLHNIIICKTDITLSRSTIVGSCSVPRFDETHCSSVSFCLSLCQSCNTQFSLCLLDRVKKKCLKIILSS